MLASLVCSLFIAFKQGQMPSLAAPGDALVSLVDLLDFAPYLERYMYNLYMSIFRHAYPPHKAFKEDWPQPII